MDLKGSLKENKSKFGHKKSGQCLGAEGSLKKNSESLDSKGSLPKKCRKFGRRKRENLLKKKVWTLSSV